MEESKLPLGTCRHCLSALDIAMTDIHEIMEDDEVSEADKEKFAFLSETVGNISAWILNMTNREMNEEDFMAEQITAELEDMWAENTEIDLLDEEIQQES